MTADERTFAVATAHPVQPAMVPAAVAVDLLVTHAGLPVDRARAEVARAMQPPSLRPVRAGLEREIAKTAAMWPECRCVLEPTMTDAELVALGAGCRAPLFCCPRLDAVRRRVL